jgi:hypothetical protein
MRRFIIGGLAALAMGTVVPLGIANAGTQHCDTTPNMFGGGYSTSCETFGDDGSWNNIAEYCSANGTAQATTTERAAGRGLTPPSR